MHPRIIADVSSNNGSVDLASYRGGRNRITSRRLLIVKRTEGVGFEDPGSADLVKRAHAHGITVMHYHFARPDNHPLPHPEAEYFASVVKPTLGKRDGVILDFETGLGQVSNSACIAYCAGFHSLIRGLLGRDLVGYANPNYLNTIGPGLGNAIRRWWIAEYGSTLHKPSWIRKLWGWQYTDGAVGPWPHAVAGIGHSDLSRISWKTYAWTVLGRRV